MRPRLRCCASAAVALPASPKNPGQALAPGHRVDTVRVVTDHLPDPGWYPAPDGTPGQFRYWTGAEWGEPPPVKPPLLSGVRIAAILFLGALQFVAVMVAFIAVAGEPDPTMSRSEEARAELLEGRIATVSCAAVFFMLAVQVVLAWPAIRSAFGRSSSGRRTDP